MQIRPFLVLLVLLASWVAPQATAQEAPVADDQSVLGPGVYVFQQRTLSATCADDDRTGYVLSFVATIDGVPGSRSMTMKLLGARYWSTWSLTVAANGEVHGESFMDGTTGENRPVNRFRITRDRGRNRDRFTGTGTRSYNRPVNGETRRCEVSVEALMRRIDA